MRVQLVGIITTALALLVWGFFLATATVRGESRTAILVLDRAHGIREGTTVTYLGVDFGVVDQLTLHDGRVVAQLRIRRKGAELRRGDIIRVRTLGLFGDKALDLIPGPRDAAILGPSDTLFAVQPPEVPPEAAIEAFLRAQERATGRAGAAPP